MPVSAGLRADLGLNSGFRLPVSGPDRVAAHLNPLSLNSPYGIKRANFKQSNPHMYRHKWLGADRREQLRRLPFGVHGG